MDDQYIVNKHGVLHSVPGTMVKGVIAKGGRVATKDEIAAHLGNPPEKAAAEKAAAPKTKAKA